MIRRRCPPQSIASAEVKNWIGKSLRPQLSDQQYAAIAKAINRFRWPGGPEPQPGDPGFIPVMEDDSAEAERWWDFNKVAEAAKLLRDHLPQIISHWDEQYFPCQSERPGPDALKRLATALDTALPYIEYPLGKAEWRPGRPPASKNWHIYALLIARAVIDTMIEAGHTRPAISRNSVVVRVVHEAMIRMKIPDVQMLTTSGVSRFLERWESFYGLTPQGIAALTTNETRALCGLFA